MNELHLKKVPKTIFITELVYRPCLKITHRIYQYRRNFTNQDFGKSLPLQTCIFDIISVEQMCLKLICISLNLYNVVKDLFRQELCMVYSSGIFLY